MITVLGCVLGCWVGFGCGFLYRMTQELKKRGLG